MAGAGDTDVIVGAELYDAGETDEGAAFVFLPEANAIVSLLSGAAQFGWLHGRRRNPM